MEPGRLTVRLDQKAVTGGDGPGEISGLASVYGNVDLQDDVMENGALNKSASDFRPGTSKIPLLDWHGDSLSRLIGSAKELKSTPAGLWFRAGFSATPEAQSARQKAVEGHLSGVSIGYLPVRQSFRTIGAKAVRVLHEVKLLEISLTPVPANPLAQVASVKAADASKPYGDVTYADPGYQEDGKHRYPLDTEAHCRAAWSYISMPKNASAYTSEQLSLIKGRIRAALKKYGVTVSAASLDFTEFSDAMRAALGITFAPAAKAAADLLVAAYQPLDDAAGPDDDPPTADAAAPDEGTAESTAGADNANYALGIITPPGPRDGAPGGEPPAALAGPLAQLEMDRAAADMDRLEAELQGGRSS